MCGGYSKLLQYTFDFYLVEYKMHVNITESD